MSISGGEEKSEHSADQRLSTYSDGAAFFSATSSGTSRLSQMGIVLHTWGQPSHTEHLSRPTNMTPTKTIKRMVWTVMRSAHWLLLSNVLNLKVNLKLFNFSGQRLEVFVELHEATWLIFITFLALLFAGVINLKDKPASLVTTHEPSATRLDQLFLSSSQLTNTWKPPSSRSSGHLPQPPSRPRCLLSLPTHLLPE